MLTFNAFSVITQTMQVYEGCGVSRIRSRGFRGLHDGRVAFWCHGGVLFDKNSVVQCLGSGGVFGPNIMSFSAMHTERLPRLSGGAVSGDGCAYVRGI